MELDDILTGVGEGLLGLNIVNAMESVENAMKLCNSLDKDELRNKLDDIYDALEDIRDELYFELKEKYPKLSETE